MSVISDDYIFVIRAFTGRPFSAIGRMSLFVESLAAPAEVMLWFGFFIFEEKSPSGMLLQYPDQGGVGSFGEIETKRCYWQGQMCREAVFTEGEGDAVSYGVYCTSIFLPIV